jgi:hypothetical protein
MECYRMLDSFQEGEYQFLDESVHELKENKKSNPCVSYRFCISPSLIDEPHRLRKHRNTIAI